MGSGICCGVLVKWLSGKKEHKRSSKNYYEKPCDNKEYSLKWIEKEETANKEHQSFYKQKRLPVFVVTRYIFFNSILKEKISDISPVMGVFSEGGNKGE